jgi:integrin beta 8
LPSWRKVCVTSPDPSGSLTTGIGPVGSLTAALPGDAPVAGLPPGNPGTPGGNGTTGGASGGGSGTGCTTTQSDLGLSCILDSISSTLVNLGTLPGAGTASPLGGLAPTLAGVVIDITGTLSNLGSLLSVSSLPLLSGGLPTTGLAGLAPGSTSNPTTPGGRGQTPSPTLGGLASVLNGVAATVGGVAPPSLPSLPLPAGGSVPTVPSFPVTTTTVPLPAPPTVGAPGTPTGGGSTTVPLPQLPVPLPTISIGGNGLILP